MLHCILASILLSSVAMGQDKILPPSKVPKIVPPHTTLEQADEDLRKKQKRRKKNRPKKKAKEKASPIALMTEQKKLWKAYSRVSFMLPYVKTTGNFRSNYLIDPGMDFNFSYRWGDENPYKKKSFWLGFRFAPFSGHGSYQNQNGRFSFLYWGPSFSIVSLKNPNISLKKPKDSSKPTKREGISTQESWRWSFGISALSRYGSVTDELSPGNGDFSNEGIAFDVPGLWSEITYGKIFGKTISLDGSLGAQIGESKLFVYASIGMGLWY